MEHIGLVRRVEEELLIPRQEEISEGSLVILPLKKKKPVALFNLKLLRYVAFVTAILWGFGLLLSARASYMYSVSMATEELQEQIVILRNENDMLKIKVEEATSMEVIAEKALALGFNTPQTHQLYQMPSIKGVTD